MRGKVLAGVLLGFIAGVFVFAFYLNLLKFYFGSPEKPCYPVNMGVKFDNYLFHRTVISPFLTKVNLNLDNLYPVLGYTRLVDNLSKTITNPADVGLILGDGFVIESPDNMNATVLLHYHHPSMTLPPDVVYLEKYGDCDDYAYFIAEMFNTSYVVSVFVVCGDRKGYHAFPIVKWGKKYIVIDYVGGVYVAGDSISQALKHYRESSGCEIYVASITVVKENGKRPPIQRLLIDFGRHFIVS